MESQLGGVALGQRAQTLRRLKAGLTRIDPIKIPLSVFYSLSVPKRPYPE